MKLYKDNNGLWVVGGKIVPQGKSLLEVGDAITISIINSNSILFRGKIEELQKENGDSYADLDELLLECKDFFSNPLNDLVVDVEGLQQDVEQLQVDVSAIQGGYLGTLLHTDAAPEPGVSGIYKFISAGVVSWLSGTPTVAVGDEVYVVFTDPTYTYTHIQNPYELLANKTQTLTDSETDYPSGKAVTEAIAVNNQTWVGVVIDPTLSSSEPAPKSTVTAYKATELKRTGNLNFHKAGESRIFNSFAPAIVNRAKKEVAWYLSKDDFSKKADGTASKPDWDVHNICIIIPDLWRRIKVVDETTGAYEVAYDIEAFDGAELWHQRSAHSISFATVNNSKTPVELVSVISNAEKFRGGNNSSARDGEEWRTQLGTPRTSLSLINFENYAENAGWETGNIKDRTMWHELTALYFANTNIQLAFTETLTAEGYPQGGLGSGMTTLAQHRWNHRSGYQPTLKIGVGSKAVGCNVGVKEFTDEYYYTGQTDAAEPFRVIKSETFSYDWDEGLIGTRIKNLTTGAESLIVAKESDDALILQDDIFTLGDWFWLMDGSITFEIPVFFGIEHLYGYLWDWGVSGVIIEKYADVENGGNGESRAWICTDFKKRSNTITEDYTLLGQVPRTDGYARELYKDFAIAKTVGSPASSNTFMSDYTYWGGSSIPASGATPNLLALRFGGYAYFGANAGVRFSNSTYDLTNTYSRGGARLRAKIEK